MPPDDGEPDDIGVPDDVGEPDELDVERGWVKSIVVEPDSRCSCRVASTADEGFVDPNAQMRF